MRNHIHEALADFEDSANWRFRSGIKQRARKNNGAGILHPAEASSANDQCQLLVRVGRNSLTVKLQRWICRSKSLQRKVLVGKWNIVSERGYFVRWRFETRKVTDSDNHAIG